MKKILLMAICATVCMLAGCKQGKNPIIPVTYPTTAKIEHVDTYFGIGVQDPYHWLENDRSDSTAAWVKSENEVTNSYLEKIPFREKIRTELTTIWNYQRQGVPSKHGNRYFVWKNDGLQNQSVLYVSEGLNGEQKVFLNPNDLSEDGTTKVGTVSVSYNNKYVAYTLSSGGSDWNEIHLKDIDGKDLPDVLKWVKFTDISWYKDGFFYSRYDAPKGSALYEKNEYQKVYYHKLGDSQEEDVLVYQDLKNPLLYHHTGTSEDERFLYLTVSQGTDGNRLYVKRLDVANAPFVLITDADFKNEYTVVENFDNEVYVWTNKDASHYRLMKADVSNRKIVWKDVIPESEDVLTSVAVIGDKLVAKYLQNAYSKLYIYDKNGSNKQEIELPEIGSVGSLSGKKGESEFFYSFTSYTNPGAIYRTANIAEDKPELYNQTKLAITPSKYVTQQVWYTSKDGTKVPMFIVHKEGIKLDGNNPTLLYGYGGFNISLSPSFSISNFFFLEQGGIYVVANLRGGGEFGSDWHKAGTHLQKQNVFDDFVAAAEYLIEKKYTSPDKLAIRGGSNGGLLVGACMTQRPDLFKVALPAVGVMDMLRFHKFTVGWGWVDDYGSSDNEEEFHYLYGYSPYHNIKQGICYPATLITTADHDDRVVPAHSFKFAAALQAAQSCDNPCLIRIDVMSGHGASSTGKAIAEYTDTWAFVFYNLNVKY
ncbi:MAG: prolyl oligopeptidase family serine peptidase [Bacteroidales bacterium]|nr:prolyl oligopeptidase family serine peptidase [Bacteroidales bacterium]